MTRRERLLAEVGNFPITSVPCEECGAGPGSCCWNNGVTAFHTARVAAAIAERDRLADFPTPHDVRDTPISNGARVAYNLSGYVAEGRVLSVAAKPNPRQWGDAWLYTFKIELQHAAYGHGKGHVSKVKDRRSILVLADVH